MFSSFLSVTVDNTSNVVSPMIWCLSMYVSDVLKSFSFVLSFYIYGFYQPVWTFQSLPFWHLLLLPLHPSLDSYIPKHPIQFLKFRVRFTSILGNLPKLRPSMYQFIYKQKFSSIRHNVVEFSILLNRSLSLRLHSYLCLHSLLLFQRGCSA